MKTINIGLYQFDELNKEAKAKALDAERYINVEYLNWYEFALDDFCEICKIIGIEVEQKNISFEGFYSQGDGSSFDSTVHIIPFINGINTKAWQQYAPLLELSLNPPFVDRRILKLIEHGTIDFVTTTQRRKGNYLKIDTDINYSRNRSINYKWIDGQLARLESWVEKSLAMLNLYLYQSLQEQYENDISDTAVKETIESNDYLFTADGKCAAPLLKLAI